MLGMKVLFICNQGQHRSKTAGEIFRDRFEAKSAGLYNSQPVTKRQLSWADTIIVMEDSRRTEIAERFPTIYLQKRILSFDIPDIYRWNQPELINLLKSKMDDLL